MAARNWLRNLTAVLIVAVVVGLVALIVQRVRSLSPTPLLEPGAGNLIADVSDIYTGFKYTESVEGKLVFMLNSVRTLGMASGWHEIEGVRLKLYDEGKEGTVLTSRLASFNKDSHDARLSGGVHVAFANGSFLDTEEGYFEAQGRRFVTSGTVTFVSARITGSAGQAAFSLVGRELQLDGGVVAQDRAGASLRAPRLTYLRDEQRLILDEGCELGSVAGRIVAERARIELDPEDGTVRHLLIEGGMTADSVADPLRGSFRGRASWLQATRDATDNWQVEATGQDQRVTLELFGGNEFFQRRVSTWHLKAVAGAGGLLNLQAVTGVCLDEVPAVGGARSAEAGTARVWFQDGRATDVELLNRVALRADGIEARGHRARVAGDGNAMMLHGSPTGNDRVVVVSERGRFQCDQVHAFAAEGRTEARGSVQGRITDAVLLATEPTSEAESPLHFAAEILEVSERGATYLLREGARAWQGRRLILADEILYRQAAETLRAVGHVRTTFPADQVDASATMGDDVVVVARSLDYSRQAREAIYRGTVRFSDSRYTLAASELKVLFNEQDEITTVEAVGAVEIVDLTTDQRVTGSTARRIVDSAEIEVTGNPAQAVDGKGNIVRGNTLTWNETSGRVAVVGATETIYFPEEQP